MLCIFFNVFNFFICDLLITFPGLPITKDLSGITLFSVIKALAPIIEFFPILALLSIVPLFQLNSHPQLYIRVTLLNVLQ